MHDELAELKNHFAGKCTAFCYLGDVTHTRSSLPNGIMIEALLPNSAPGRAKLFEVGDAVGRLAS